MEYSTPNGRRNVEKIRLKITRKYRVAIDREGRGKINTPEEIHAATTRGTHRHINYGD